MTDFNKQETYEFFQSLNGSLVLLTCPIWDVSSKSKVSGILAVVVEALPTHEDYLNCLNKNKVQTIAVLAGHSMEKMQTAVPVVVLINGELKILVQMCADGVQVLS
jgi:hypothetical protein